MKCYIASTSRYTPTAFALEREGEEFELVLMKTKYSYAHLIYELFSKGEGFILLEHDIVPWPGAIKELRNCKEDWCTHKYPFAPNAIRWAMGCIKLSSNIVRNGKIPKGLLSKEWNQVDGTLIPAIIRHTEIKAPHIHVPHFSHVKGFLECIRQDEETPC